MPKEKIRIKEGMMIAKIAARMLKSNKVAIVIAKTIYVYGVSIPNFVADKKWLLHELKHVQQYQEQGTIIFLLKYIYYTMRYGYYDNPYEKEARNAEDDNSILELYEW